MFFRTLFFANHSQLVVDGISGCVASVVVNMILSCQVRKVKMLSYFLNFISNRPEVPCESYSPTLEVVTLVSPSLPQPMDVFVNVLSSAHFVVLWNAPSFKPNCSVSFGYRYSIVNIQQGYEIAAGTLTSLTTDEEFFLALNASEEYQFQIETTYGEANSSRTVSANFTSAPGQICNTIFNYDYANPVLKIHRPLPCVLSYCTSHTWCSGFNSGFLPQISLLVNNFYKPNVIDASLLAFNLSNSDPNTTVTLTANGMVTLHNVTSQNLSLIFALLPSKSAMLNMQMSYSNINILPTSRINLTGPEFFSSFRCRYIHLLIYTYEYVYAYVYVNIDR